MNEVLSFLQALLGDAGVFAALALVLGWIGKPAVQFIKDRLGWENKKALLLALGVSALLAVVHAWIVGDLVLENITAEGLAASLGAVYTFTQLIYRWFKTGSLPEDES